MSADSRIPSFRQVRAVAEALQLATERTPSSDSGPLLKEDGSDGVGSVLRPIAAAVWRRSEGRLCACLEVFADQSPHIPQSARNRIQLGLRQYAADLGRQGTATSALDAAVASAVEGSLCGYQPVGVRSLEGGLRVPKGPCPMGASPPPPVLLESDFVVGRPLSTIPTAATLEAHLRTLTEAASNCEARDAFQAATSRAMVVRGIVVSSDAQSVVEDTAVRTALSKCLSPTARIQGPAVDLCHISDRSILCVLGSLRGNATYRLLSVRDFRPHPSAAVAAPQPRSNSIIDVGGLEAAAVPPWLVDECRVKGASSLLKLCLSVAAVDLRLWGVGEIPRARTSTVASPARSTVEQRARSGQREYACEAAGEPSLGVLITSAMGFRVLQGDSPLRRITVGATQCSPRLLEALCVAPQSSIGHLVSVALDEVGDAVSLPHITAFLCGCDCGRRVPLSSLSLRNMPTCFDASPYHLREFGHMVGTMLVASTPFSLEISACSIPDAVARIVYSSIVFASSPSSLPPARRRLLLGFPHNRLTSVEMCFTQAHTSSSREDVTLPVLMGLSLAGNALSATGEEDLEELVRHAFITDEIWEEKVHAQQDDQEFALEADERRVRQWIFAAAPVLNLDNCSFAPSAGGLRLKGWLRRMPSTRIPAPVSWAAQLGVASLEGIPTPFCEPGIFHTLQLAGAARESSTARKQLTRHGLGNCVAVFPWVADHPFKELKRWLRQPESPRATRFGTTTELAIPPPNGDPPDTWEDALSSASTSDDVDAEVDKQESRASATVPIPTCSPPFRHLAVTCLCLAGWDFSPPGSVARTILPVLPGLVTLDLSRTGIEAIVQLRASLARCTEVLGFVSQQLSTVGAGGSQSNLIERFPQTLPLQNLLLDGCDLCSPSNSHELSLLLRALGASCCPSLRFLSLRDNNCVDVQEASPPPKGTSSRTAAHQLHNHPSTKTKPHTQKASMQRPASPTQTPFYDHLISLVPDSSHDIPVGTKEALLAFLDADAKARKRRDAPSSTGSSAVDPLQAAAASRVEDMHLSPFAKVLCTFLSAGVSALTFARLDLSGCSQGVPNLRCVLHIQKALDDGKCEVFRGVAEGDVKTPSRAVVHMRHVDAAWEAMLPNHPLFNLPADGTPSHDGRKYVTTAFC